jgi:hypothetical protein
MLASQKGIRNSTEKPPPVLFVCVLLSLRIKENMMAPQMGNENEPMHKERMIVSGNSERKNLFKMKN